MDCKNKFILRRVFIDCKIQVILRMYFIYCNDKLIEVLMHFQTVKINLS